MSHSTTGEWFIPGGNKYPGQLIYDNEKIEIRLEIFGQHFIEGLKMESFDTRPAHFHKLILRDHGTQITLCNCHWNGSSEIGKDLYRVTYIIDYVFIGILFTDEHLPVLGGTFLMPNLSTWYDGSLVLDKLKGKQGLYIDGVHTIQNVLTNETVRVNNNLQINFRDEVQERIKNITTSYIVEYIKYVSFWYNTEVPFDALLKDSILLLKLLSFSFGKPLSPKIISVNVNPQMLSKSETDLFIKPNSYPLVYVNNYSLSNNNNEIENNSSHMSHMLLSNWRFSKEEMNQFIQKWLANEKFYPLYEYYNDSNNWLQGTKARLSHIMYNNRFLNLIQGLELFFKLFYLPLVNKTSTDLKPLHKKTIYLKNKLEMLLDFFKEDLSILFEGISLSEFSTSASRFRNELSHGAAEIDQGIRLHEDYYIAQILLAVCILKTLEVNDIKTTIAEYSKFNDSSREIYFYQKQRGLI